MTPRERAESLQKEFAEFGNQSTFDFVSRVEAMIAAAVEEERERTIKACKPRMSEATLEKFLDAANDRIEELEAERQAVLDALGVEIIDDDSESKGD